LAGDRDVAPSRGRAPLSPLHRAKLRHPRIAEHYIRRPRLLALLDDLVRSPLTLIVAPAGSGKTSLLAGWVAETSTPVAWFSLDEGDRDVAELWTGMIAALEKVAPGCGQGALRLVRQPRRDAEAIDRLLVDLDAEARPTAVVVIDDLHLVDGHDAVMASLRHFLLHLPSWLHVVLVSRREPDLPIDRMRSRGEIGEIRFAELRFSPEEAAELLHRLTPSLAEGRVDTAVESADGWATSLHLAALAARSIEAQAHPPASPVVEEALAQDQVLVQDYVLHEVLGGEAPEVRQLLAAAAVVPRINPSLAQALTGSDDAGRLLGVAERRGLFLTRRGTGGWFELHALVRSVLTTELRATAPQQLAELHSRAAKWYEQEDEAAPALDQWLLADRPRDALRLLAQQHARLYESGREATIVRTIECIPVAVATNDLEAMVAYAWCHLLIDRRRFVELVEQLAWWAERSTPDDLLRARITMLRADAATISGNWVEGGTLAHQAMEGMGERWWQDFLGRFGWNLVAREVALSERWNDADDKVREAELALSRDVERRLAFEGVRAMGLAFAGRPLDAIRIAAGVRRAVAVADMTILRTELATAEALAHRELGDRAAAARELHALSEAPAETMLYCRVLATLELTQLRLDEGDLDRARHEFARAATLIEEEGFGSGGRNWLHRTGTVLALAQGDIDDAWHWVHQLGDPFWARIGEARVYVATGALDEAEAALATASPRCPRHEVVHRLLLARSLRDGEEAMKCAAGAVELAASHGLLQTVASEGPQVLELVEHAAWTAPAEWLDRLRRLAADAPARTGQSGLELVEPLTERERDVLRFLPSRLTVREIADELYISVNTLKFHLRVIYRKLGVNSRAEAAEVARKMTSIRR
jgi:LuxR family maltose regulon positive regulatory protein